MPKFPSFPTLYDDCKTLSITFLKKYGYLDPGTWKTGTVSWSRNGEVVSSIGIGVCMFGEQPYLEFNYKCRDNPINYRVNLVSLPSNIGRGLVWYFLCPSTAK